jgi:[ribosomal protein S18]-alanine N-acetyltransferase
MSAVLKSTTAARRQASELRVMTPADIPSVMLIENDIYPFPWTAGNFADSLAAGYRCWLHFEGSAVVGGNLAAYAVVMIGAGEAHLLNLSVAREYQGRGLGARMLAMLMTNAQREGAHNMLLEVRPSNAAGIALYSRAGFTQLGQRRGYYPAHQGREDALVFGCSLPAAAGA